MKSNTLKYLLSEADRISIQDSKRSKVNNLNNHIRMNSEPPVLFLFIVVGTIIYTILNFI